MARITQDEIKVGDAVSVTSPNSTLAEWRAQSTNVDADNVREEGLHRRNFAANAVVGQPSAGQYISSSSGSMTLATASRSLVVIGGTNIVIGPFAYDSFSSITTGTPKQEVIIFASLQYRNGGHPAGLGHGTAPVWNMCLSYSTNWNGSTGTWTPIDETLRKTGFNIDPTATTYRHGSISWAHRFMYVGTLSSVYFAIQAWEPVSAKPIEIEYVTMHALIAKR